MKIILTPAELIALVAYRYHISCDTALTVEVESDKTDYTLRNALLADQIVLRQYRAGHITETGDIRSDKRIAAIKLLREQIPNSGLCNAKWAIENWGRFISHISHNGIPDLSSEITDFPWIKPPMPSC